MKLNVLEFRVIVGIKVIGLKETEILELSELGNY